ncbi:MAG TPA: hypothetical protein VFM70_03245 [Salinimicrobium sp.]|nr:hypothetical protein [Salinimicrobium sp.]
MKKFQILFTLLGSLFIVSCSDDNENFNDDDQGTDPVQDELFGEITGELILNADTDYTLTGVLSVENNAALTIPAGTKITANAGTNIYIVVQKGGKIFVQGTATNPVRMTSQNANPGDWGGLVILGDAVTTAGINATAEVGQLVYGGTDNSDNSGSINYLIIEGAGAQINADSQYNGLSLYAVGSGTTINNIAIVNGADDGVEFFGGSVSATNIYLKNNEDDAVDWTEGWNGTISNTYVLHSIEGFSTAIEADGINNNPLIENFTAVSTTGGTALQFKIESGATISNLNLEGYDTNIDMANDGPLSNVQINGANASLEMQYEGTPVDISTWNWISGL